MIIEVPMNNEVKDIGSKQPEQTRENNSFYKLSDNAFISLI